VPNLTVKGTVVTVQVVDLFCTGYTRYYRRWYAPIAQLDRAPASGAGCGRSSRPRGASFAVWASVKEVFGQF
jgi:hypothetical protein